MTFFELWKWGEKRLADSGIREADLDAKYLLLEPLRWIWPTFC